MPARPFIHEGVKTRRRPAPCCFLVMRHNMRIDIDKYFYNVCFFYEIIILGVSESQLIYFL